MNSWSERATLVENVFVDEGDPEMAEFHDANSIYRAAMKTSALVINEGNILLWLLPAVLPMLVVGPSCLPFSQLGPIKRLLLH